MGVGELVNLAGRDRNVRLGSLEVKSFEQLVSHEKTGQKRILQSVLNLIMNSTVHN